MFKLTHLLAIAAIFSPTAIFAEDAPKPEGTTVTVVGDGTAGSATVTVVSGGGDNSGDNGGDRNREGDRNRGGEDRRAQWLARMAEENPELKGVDINTPEGQEKLREVMQKRMEKEMPRIRERIAEGKARDLAELNKKIGMSSEEFTAIQPLIERVENLQSQHRMVDPGANSGSPFGRGRGGPGGGMFNSTMLLGDTELEPSLKEIQDAAKVLKTLTADAQANETEIVSALARLRKAREAFNTILKTARNELRSVLTAKQEAMLVERGTLD